MEKPNDNSETEIYKTIYQHILNYCPSSLKETDLHPDLSLFADGLGLDSVAAVELILELEDAFGFDFPAEMYETKMLTIGQLVSYVENKKKRHGN